MIINAIMLGLSRKEARDRFDDIIAFAELEEFIDLKLKNYSSGMYVRLAFATAIQVDADILLIDEVLAVGDAAFQQKCFDEFARLQQAGERCVFVTHDMGAVERFCDRAMLLERGRVVDIGEPASIARQYNQHNFRRWREEGGGPEDELPPEDPAATVVNAVVRIARRRDRGHEHPGRAVPGPDGASTSARRSTDPIVPDHSAGREPTAPCSPPTPTRSTSTPGRSTPAATRRSGCGSRTTSRPGATCLVASVARPGFGAERHRTPT